jgi:hypothetical protein
VADGGVWSNLLAFVAGDFFRLSVYHVGFVPCYEGRRVMLLVFVLLAIFQLKHFICDYPLQRSWILFKFHPHWKSWIPALAAHAAVHALFTFAIVFFLFSWTTFDFALSLAAFDFAIHFIMDRIKAGPKLMGRWKPLTSNEYSMCKDAVAESGNAMAKCKLRDNGYFWYALGFDQMVHHFTHYAIIWMLVR